MSLGLPIPGQNSVPDYLVPGVPFITSSLVPGSGFFSVALPFISSDVTIRNTSSSSVQFGVTRAGAQATNYFTIPANSEEYFYIRTTTVFLYAPGGSTTVSILVGLTTIPELMFPLLTGSNGISGVG
jgi:hypothetical protein